MLFGFILSLRELGMSYSNTFAKNIYLASYTNFSSLIKTTDRTELQTMLIPPSTDIDTILTFAYPNQVLTMASSRMISSDNRKQGEAIQILSRTNIR